MPLASPAPLISHAPTRLARLLAGRRLGFAIVLLALLLRIGFLLQTCHLSLWLDELYSAEWSTGRSLVQHDLPHDVLIEPPPRLTSMDGRGPIAQVWTCLANDVQAPAYYVLLRLWREAFGPSDLAMIALSILLSTAAVPLVFATANRLAGRGAALWAGLLMAVTPTQLLFSRDVRPYVLLITIVAAAYLLLARMVRAGGRWPWHVAVAVLFLLAMLTHYFAFGALLGLALWALIVLAPRQRWRLAICLAAAGVVFLALWGPMLLAQWHHMRASGNTDWMKDLPGTPWTEFWIRLACIPFRFLAEVYGHRPLVAVVAGLGLFLLTTWRLRRRPELWGAWTWMIGTLVVVAVLDVAFDMRQLSYVRFWVLASPAFCLLVAGLAPRDPAARWYRHLIPAAVTLVMVAASLAGVPYTQVRGRAPIRIVEDAIATHVPPSGVLVIDRRSALWPPQQTYLSLAHDLPVLPRAVVLSDHADLPPAILAALRARGGFWCITVYEAPTDNFPAPSFDGFRPQTSLPLPTAGILTHFVPDGPLTASPPRAP